MFRTDDRLDSKQEARSRFTAFCDKWAKYYSYFIKQKENPRTELYFTYIGYDYRIRLMIKTTNWIERLNRDFKRTTRMRGALPSPEATLLLLGAVARDKKLIIEKSLDSRMRKINLNGQSKIKKNNKNMFNFVLNQDNLYTQFGILPLNL